MILQEGFICKHYTFVVKGCFKMYAIDEKGMSTICDLLLKTIGLRT